jgi:hypothetical protein
LSIESRGGATGGARLNRRSAPFGCSADNRQTTQTIPVAALVLIARFVGETLVEVPPLGQDNVGDSFLFTEDLFTQAGRAVGHD